MKVRLSKCSISQAEVDAAAEVLRSEYLGMGQEVAKFESAIKNYLGTTKDVVCVNTGTSALHLALASLDLQVGDEVLVPSLTFVATFQAISATGAIPIACEIDPNTLFISVDDAKTKITNKTKVIMPVHYASASLGMEAVYALAQEYGLRVVEDAAQAFGCVRNGEKVGVVGDVICFSFDGIKNITSGEGGAIITSDVRLLEKLKDGRLLGVKKDSDMRYQGQRSWDFDVEYQGFRFHMSNINAAIGLEQLKRINVFKKKRQLIVQRYLEGLKLINEVTPLDLNYTEMMSHIFVVKTNKRDELRAYLIQAGVECGVHYKPNHLLAMYKTDNPLPVTESTYGKILTLPCHVDLTQEEQCFVILKIGDFFDA